jgi:cell division septum initiation protein DivIVA
LNVQQKLDALAELIENARAMPMSASCIVNRAEVLDLLDDVRATLPQALADAQGLLARQDAVVAEGRHEADRIIDAAYAEQARLVSQTEVFRQAQIEGERLVHEAETSAERTRGEVDDYVDARLANFEVVLHKTLGTVERGRAKLSGRGEKDDLTTGSPAPADDTDEDGEPQG